MAALRCILTIAAASALPQGWEATLTKELQKIADHETAKWNTSFSIAFQNGAGSASAAAGDIGGGKSSTVDDDYVWGSVTKVVTGASILKLASEGRFDLRSPMAPLVDRFLAKLAKQPDWRHDWSSLGELWGDQNVSTATRSRARRTPCTATARRAGTRRRSAPWRSRRAARRRS